MELNDSFSSSVLQDLDLEADSIISLHLQKLNTVSRDIKLLEERLNNAAIPFAFFYIFSYEVETQPESFSRDIKIRKYHCLVWVKAVANYRLFYNLYKAKSASYDPDNPESVAFEERTIPNPDLVSSKPLIEAKSYIRLSTKDHLPGFYKKLIDALKSEKAHKNIVTETSSELEHITIPTFYFKSD